MLRWRSSQRTSEGSTGNSSKDGDHSSLMHQFIFQTFYPRSFTEEEEENVMNRDVGERGRNLPGQLLEEP